MSIIRQTHIETCQSCKIIHPEVECIGIYHCPNALCSGCGGAWFREKLDSYKQINEMEHTVCEKEWLEKGIGYNKNKGIKRKKIRKNLGDK